LKISGGSVDGPYYATFSSAMTRRRGVFQQNQIDRTSARTCQIRHKRPEVMGVHDHSCRQADRHVDVRASPPRCDPS